MYPGAKGSGFHVGDTPDAVPYGAFEFSLDGMEQEQYFALLDKVSTNPNPNPNPNLT